jgi:hypothetical protein
VFLCVVLSCVGRGLGAGSINKKEKNPTPEKGIRKKKKKKKKQLYGKMIPGTQLFDSGPPFEGSNHHRI